MAIIQFETSSSPVIHIESYGNLHLLGQKDDALIYKGAPSEAVTEEEVGEVYRIKSDATCQVQVPVAATVIIANVHGNSQFKGVNGPITIEKIGGNLSLYQIGPAIIKKIYGNLKIQEVNGDLEVHSVYGNITAQDVSGNLQIHEKAKGNLIIRQVGSLHASALGNVTLGLDPQPDLLYHVEASGNIHCSIPVDASVELYLKSSSRQIQVNFPDKQEKINEHEYSLIRNEGMARITMISKGYIHLTGMSSVSVFSPDLGIDFGGGVADVTDEISGLIDLQMAALEQQINERLSHIPDLEENTALHNDIDEIVEQARQYSTNAAFKAQEKAQKAAQRAQAKLTRKLEKARRKTQRQSSRPSWQEQNRSQQWAPGRSSTTGGDPVSEEERLLILKMLEDNKITLDEADQLLAALEGKED